jgi:hypothetical protein
VSWLAVDHPSTGSRRRWFAQPGWIAVLTVLVLVAAGLGT